MAWTAARSLLGDIAPGDGAADLHAGEGDAEQADVGGGDGVENVVGDGVRVRAEGDELAGE